MKPSEHHIAFADLLIGRIMRGKASELLERAIKAESEGRYNMALLTLECAANAEWIATIAERGQVAWGGRFNRCSIDTGGIGFQPKDELSVNTKEVINEVRN